MASEIRVNKLNSQTGVGTITLSPTGVDISGITTAATLKATTGIVTTLTVTTGIVTSLSANEFGVGTDNPSTELEIQAATDPKIRLQSQESGNKRLDLYVDGGEAVGTIAADQSSSQLAFRTSGAERLRIEAAGNLKSNHNLSVTGIATVGSAVTISESGIEASGIGITCANINGTQIGGRRNLVINGAMNIAQRGTSSTSSGFRTVDRFRMQYGGTDEAPTQAQADVTSGTSPYTSGFRKAFKITNGNQTGGVAAGDYIQFDYTFEAQDIANSGWNYTSSSSFITFSFWIKSSVAQAFSGSFRTVDGSAYSYKFTTSSLSANTWTKVIKTIPGNSNLTFDNNSASGLILFMFPYIGTTYTTANSDTETWVSAGNNYADDMTSTWYTTNDATFEITGVQLEVGSQATPFEHRSFADELRLCQRYYYKSTQYSYPVQNPIETGQTVEGDGFLGWAFYNNTNCRSPYFDHPVEMRATPSVNFYSSARVASPTDGKMALYTQSAWVNLSANTATVNTRRMGIKGTSATNFSEGSVYLIGGGFECVAEL